jgi:hypothetical protein
MEAAGSSETLLTIYQTTLRHISEESNLHSHRHENSKSLALNLCVSYIGKDPYKGAGNIKFEVLTKMSIMITAFWDATPCSTL